VAIRAILFDKDGTLVDFDRTWGPAVQAVLRKLSHGDDGLYRKLCALSGVDDAGFFKSDSLLIGQPTNVFAARWAQFIGRPAETAFFADVDRLLCRETTANLTPIGEPRDILGELAQRGYRLGLSTNDAEATARTHARKLGIDSLLEFIAGYDSGFGAKPAPGQIAAFAAAVGVSTPEIAAVGDTAPDVTAARAAGARAALVLTGPNSLNSLRQVMPDAVLASITELPAWLKRFQPAPGT